MPLLTSQELAAELRLNEATIRRWRRQGRIRPAVVTVGGQARWDLDDVKRQLEKIQDEQ